jgi:hypothetical protein
MVKLNLLICKYKKTADFFLLKCIKLLLFQSAAPLPISGITLPNKQVALRF